MIRVSLVFFIALGLLGSSFFETSLAASSRHAWKSGPAGAPGIPHLWAPALKQAIGTSWENKAQGVLSPVWFTIAEGVLTEVFYPSVDQPQLGDLQVLVTDGKEFFAEQKKDVRSSVRFSPGGSSVLIQGEERRGYFRLEQEVITDPRFPVVRIRSNFKPSKPNLKLFVLFKPAIQNQGSQNRLSVSSKGFLATHDQMHPSIFATLVSSVPWSATGVGYVGFSDGWQDLSKHFRLTEQWSQAGPGNVAGTGELSVPVQGDFSFELALSFANSVSQAFVVAEESLQMPFEVVQGLYDQGWQHYFDEIETFSSQSQIPTRFLKESALARRSVQLIKMHEDKLKRGAIVASLSKPAIPAEIRAADGGGGYHLIWPRDLYHAAMGLLAAGDRQTPVDVLHYLVETQDENGSWSQNFWVNGMPYWQGLQMDEVALPILLAFHLAKRGIHVLCRGDIEMVKKAASFLSAKGPKTPQDRWEETGGFVPSTLAVEIAALRSAFRLTGTAQFGLVAKSWSDRLEDWTVVSDGPHGQNYFLRASSSGKPSQLEWIELANGAGWAFAFDIIDGGFLELVRYKIREPQDHFVLNSLKIYESPRLGIAAGVTGMEGLVYKRYNRDAYGPGHDGGYWPLLAGERGLYAVMSGDLKQARAQLFLLESLALESGLIPEQVQTLAPLRVGLGVASPLIWAHAEQILLHRSIEEGQVFDAP